jgi:hypothetical protein
MALVIADRVREQSTTTGAGTLTLTGAVVGFQTFSSAIGNGNTTYYTISNPGTTEWEVGVGTVSAGQLARTTILSSSNAGSLVNFSAGTKDVFVTYPAEKSVNLDVAGDITGYSIENSPIGAGTANTGAFTSLTASLDSSFTSTGALLISKGTTGEQPGTPATGMVRYNTTSNEFEGYSGSSPAWKSIGGSALSNDTTTATDLYPLFAAATSGTAQNIYTSNAKYLYKPSTGELQASELLASNGVVLNNQTMNANYTMPSGYSGMSTGPFTVAGGVTFTIPSGSRHVVL